MRGLFGLLLILAALWAAHGCVEQQATAIEADIDQRVAQALSTTPWAEHTVDGRFVTLRGAPPSEAVAEQLQAEVRSLAGVCCVTAEWQSAPPAGSLATDAPPDNASRAVPPAVVLTAQVLTTPRGRVINLAGTVADARQARAIVRYSASRHPTARIDNLLRTADAASPDQGFDQAVAASLFSLLALDTGTLQVSRSRITLRGLPASALSALAIEQALQRNAPPAYVLDVQLMRDQEHARAPRIQTSDALHRCQDEFNALMRDHRIGFGHDSDTIDAGSAPLLDRIAAQARACAGPAILIEGHSDASGDPAYNLDLSTRRARAVRRALIERGVPAARLQAKGYGDTRPLVGNDTREGRARNRRIEFRLLQTPPAAP